MRSFHFILFPWRRRLRSTTYMHFSFSGVARGKSKVSITISIFTRDGRGMFLQGGRGKTKVIVGGAVQGHSTFAGQGIFCAYAEWNQVIHDWSQMLQQRKPWFALRWVKLRIYMRGGLGLQQCFREPEGTHHPHGAGLTFLIFTHLYLVERLEKQIGFSLPLIGWTDWSMARRGNGQHWIPFLCSWK